MSEKSRLMKLKRENRKKKPAFKRQEQDFEIHLKNAWRRPRGRHSKLRKHEKGRGAHPSSGYCSPSAVKGLNRLGFQEVRVFTPADLEFLEPEKHSVVIGSSVGKKKRMDILKKASEMKLRVEN